MIDLLKCPADLSTKLVHGKNSGGNRSYFETKGSSYEWFPLYEGENVHAPRQMVLGSLHPVLSSRVRLLMDYAESGEAPHHRSADASGLNVFYADGSVRTVTLQKQK
jgi:prepilin-type processing-associated H-X9-DG protein